LSYERFVAPFVFIFIACPEIRKLVIISGTTGNFKLGMRPVFRNNYRFEVFRKPRWKFRRTITDLWNKIQNAEMQSIILCISCLIHIKIDNSFKPVEGQKERTYVRIACTTEIKVFMEVVKKWMVPAKRKFDYKRRVIWIIRNRYNIEFSTNTLQFLEKHQIKDSSKMIRNPIELEKIIESKYFGNTLHSRA